MLKNSFWIVSLLMAITLFANTEDPSDDRCAIHYNICMDECLQETSPDCAQTCRSEMEQCDSMDADSDIPEEETEKNTPKDQQDTKESETD